MEGAENERAIATLNGLRITGISSSPTTTPMMQAVSKGSVPDR